MAEISIDSLQEFYTIEFDSENDLAILRNNRNEVVNTQTMVSPTYGGLYTAFTEDSVLTLDSIQYLDRGTPEGSGEQSVLVPAFSNYIETEGFEGPFFSSTTTSDENDRILIFSDVWVDTGTGDRFQDRVQIFAGGHTSTEQRNTTALTRIPTLKNLMASDFRSLATIEDVYEYTSNRTFETFQVSGGLVTATLSYDFACDRTMRFTVSASDVGFAGQAERQGISYDRPENFFDTIESNYRYIDGFEVGTFDENTNVLTLDNPVTNREIYYLGGSTVITSYNRDINVVEFDDVNPRLTLSAIISLFEGIAGYSKTVYERRPVDFADLPIGPWSPITSAQFVFGNQEIRVQDGQLNFGYITGVTNSNGPPATDLYSYFLRQERSLIGAKGYLCRSKGQGLFDVYTADCFGLSGQFSIDFEQVITQQNELPAPTTLSYSTVELLNVALIQEDLPFWPHAVEGKDTFAARNWESMNCQQEDMVLYGDTERAILNVNDGGNET